MELKKLNGKLCALVLAPVLLAPLSAEAVSGVLVQQPVYSGMNFYVHRPAGMPNGWYVTYDGYPVYRNAGGVWMYGSANGPSIATTAYVVGSVVPSVAGIVPWVAAPSVAELPTPAPMTPPQVAWPQHASWVATTAQPVVAPIVAPAPASAPVLTAAPAYVPARPLSPAFLALGRWGKSVDRVGVLKKPAVPVAWKGAHPKVIYAWTGLSWHQITTRTGNPLSELRGQAYELTVLSNRENSAWNNSDTSALIGWVAGWGYGWMGQISLARF